MFAASLLRCFLARTRRRESRAENERASSYVVNVREATGNPHQRSRVVRFRHLTQERKKKTKNRQRTRFYKTARKRTLNVAPAPHTRRKMEIKKRMHTSIMFPPFTSSTRHTASPSSETISTSTSCTCDRTCLRLALMRVIITCCCCCYYYCLFAARLDNKSLQCVF